MRKLRFTLVELVVIAATLAILLTFLIPSMRNVMNSSRSLVCLNNMKIQGVAFANYASDFMVFPNFRQAKSTSRNQKINHSVYWDDLLGMGYDGRDISQALADKVVLLNTETHGGQIYACPMDDSELRVATFPFRKNFDLDPNQAIPKSYVMNSFRSMNGIATLEKQGVAGMAYNSYELGPKFIPWSQSLENIPKPSALLLTVEHPNRGYVGGAYSSFGNSPAIQDGSMKFFENYGNSTVDTLRVRYHNGGYHYLFADAHTENLLPEETLGKSPKASLSNPMGGYWSSNPND